MRREPGVVFSLYMHSNRAHRNAAAGFNGQELPEVAVKLALSGGLGRREVPDALGD